MKIGVLTSSRADFGIYLPLLGSLKLDPFSNLKSLLLERIYLKIMDIL